MDWTRNLLMAALSTERKADRVCRQALKDGAAFTPPASNLISSSWLSDLYDRRRRHTLRLGIPTIGLDQAVELLRSRHEDVLLGLVQSAKWNFVLFLDPVEPIAVACTAVAASAANR